MTASVPVLVLSGAVGSGKSTIGRYVAKRLREADVSHALLDHEWLAYSWPVPPNDPWNERVAAQNLGRVWANFHAAGAARLVYCRVLETRSLLDYVSDAVPGAAPIVVQLRAPFELVEERLRAREPEADWYLEVASDLVPRMEASEIADFVVDNAHRAPDDVAEEILRLLQWLA